MAKSNYGPGIPADQPATVGPGDLVRREREFFADSGSGDRGIYVGFSDSTGSFGEGGAGNSRGGRRPSMTGGQLPTPPSFKLKKGR